MTIKKFTIALTLGMILPLAAGCNSGSGNSNGQGGGIDPNSTGIPAEVLNYEGSIDAILYIEGQNGTLSDIGDESLYGPSQINDTYLARFAGAAREFKKIAPKVNINVHFCSIPEYNDLVAGYQAQYGHLPHIMHGVDHVDRMIAKGFSADLTRYAESEYYKAFDPSIMELFNFGGFQGAVPYMMIPMGVFANTKALEDNYYEYNDRFFMNQDGSVEWTFEKFVEISANVFSPGQQAAIGSITQDFLSYSVPTVNMQLRDERTVELNTDLVREMLDLEEDLVPYSVYNYPRTGPTDVKEGFTGVATFWGAQNYINEEKYVFNAEAPWNIGYFALRAQSANKDRDFDYLPWPAAEQETGMTVGMIAEGLTIGNQCPIDATGVPDCGEKGLIEQDVAAYFTMFMNVDPRAIDAKSKIQWTDSSGTQGSTLTTGILDLPMVRREFNFAFEDPDAGYVFDNLMQQYFNFYYTYIEDLNNPTINLQTFEGLKPGMKQMMNIYYNELEKRILFYAIPNQIPNTDGTTKEIMAEWLGRHTTYELKLGQEGWSSYVKSILPELQAEINTNMDLTWALLQEGLDMYYGPGKYDVSLNVA